MVGDLLWVRGLRVGHASDPSGRTGVTAIVFERGAPSVVDVRGGASGTYDTASLALESTFGRRWAIFFSGGSLFGLDAARGVRRVVLASGAGSTVFGTAERIAPISGAVLFDLPGAPRPLPDYAELGARAARGAHRRRLAQGRVGAGTGATVAKYLGRAAAVPGGLGSSARRLGGGRSVGVLTVVNAAGAVRDPSTGAWAAVARGPGGRDVPPEAISRRPLAGRGTTLTLVATDLPLPRPALARVVSIVHAGLGRAIVPYLTSVDGDCVFGVATAERSTAPREPWPGALADRLGRLAADAAVEAVLAAVRTPVPGGR